MAVDPAIFIRNRASTQRMRDLAARLSDAELQTRVGEHWTVAIVFVHLAFWDRRVTYVLEKTVQEGKVFIPNIDISINDLSLPLWAAIPPREATRIGIETAEALDHQLECYSPALLEAVFAYNQRWVDRSLHRGEHLGEADASLKAS